MKKIFNPGTFRSLFTQRKKAAVEDNSTAFNNYWEGAWIKKLAKFILPVVAWILPAIAAAQANAITNGLQTTGLQTVFGNGGLNNSQSLSDLIVNVIRIMLAFSGAIAIGFVVVGGYQYVTSGGNEEQAEQGKKNIINAIIGIVIIVLAYVIINVLVNLVSTNSGYGF